MADFFSSHQCTSGAHCKSCRVLTSFRQKLYASGVVPSVDFECPKGLTADDFAKAVEPTVASLVQNFSRATYLWGSKGFPLVKQGEFTRRLDVCRGCALWDESGYAGRGRCRHGQCGCTKLKHWLKTEKCPLDFW